jgi:hypothetical protein
VPYLSRCPISKSGQSDVWRIAPGSLGPYAWEALVSSLLNGIHRLVLASLRAVSGAPIFSDWLIEALWGRFGYSDLKEAAGSWGCYGI